MSKSCVKGTRVCLAVDLHNGELPRGSDLSHFTETKITNRRDDECDQYTDPSPLKKPPLWRVEEHLHQ